MSLDQDEVLITSFVASAQQQKPPLADADDTTEEFCGQGAPYKAPDSTKQQNVKNVHIPYILNGQLYEIQTQDGENVTVRCCHCPPDRVYRGSVRSTGNFHMHIKRRHPDLLGKLHDMKVNAILERRDRLMKSRKITYRGSRSSNCNKSRGQERLDYALPKLKIKSAFQRHQFQQQQQQQQQQQHLQQNQEDHAPIRNWNIKPFVVVPIGDGTNMTDIHAEPINYSFKPDNINSVNVSRHQVVGENNVKPLVNRFQQQEVELSMFTISNSQQAVPINNEPPQLNNDNSNSFDYASDETRCASTIASFGSNISVGHSNHNTITIVKNELLMPNEAIDLTLQNSSISSGIGSTQTTPTIGRSFSDNNAAGSTLDLKMIELLQKVEISLKEIQRQMCARNQIENNRISLDIAKFKYLHPAFDFQC